MTIRDISVAFGFDVDRASQQQAENSIKGIKNMATKLLGKIAVVFSVAKLTSFAKDCRLPGATGAVVPVRVCSTCTSPMLVLARAAASASAPLSMESWTLRFDICKAAVKPPYSKE